MSRNTRTANTTTVASTSNNSEPTERFGNALLSRRLIRSVPPVVAPRTNITPMPMPQSTPPSTAASRMLLEYGGRIAVKRSMKKDKRSVVTMVLTSGRMPSFHQASPMSGTLSASVQTPTESGVICASAVARPLTPPGAMLLGMVNSTSPAATRPLPSTMAMISKNQARNDCFIYLLPLLGWF
ncbi:hypothetical protein SDC9_56499 [bioreactor metagenome]|uniref:Uncharacterized protein n=1 Tax=bioreactor metagenome TaxID=1076179 RepID=A0A644X7Q5_9ZZZZ